MNIEQRKQSFDLLKQTLVASSFIDKYSIDGITIDIFSNVYSPKLFSSKYSTDRNALISRYLSDYIKNRSFMEIGTATGILSLYIRSKNNNQKVAVVDIDPDAIANAKHNFLNADIDNVTYYVSDIFNSIDPHEKYDCIFYGIGVWDYDWSLLERYVNDVFNYITPNGTALVYLTEEPNGIAAAMESIKRHGHQGEILYNVAHENSTAKSIIIKIR